MKAEFRSPPQHGQLKSVVPANAAAFGLVAGMPALTAHEPVFVVGDQEVSQFCDDSHVNVAGSAWRRSRNS